MSKSEVSAPVSSVASDRLALGVGWVRPGAGGIGGTLNPSYTGVGIKLCSTNCFEGNEESHAVTPLGGVFNPCCWPLTAVGPGPVYCSSSTRRCATLGSTAPRTQP